MTRCLVASFSAALLLSVPALAQEKKAAPPAADAAAAPQGQPPAPAPSKELAAWMKGMEGSWKCETKMMAGSMGPGSPEMTGKSTVKFTKEMGGMWFRGDYAVAKSKTMPGMTVVFFVGHDENTKLATQVSYGSMGGAAMETGTLTADTITTTGDGTMMGKTMKMRETMTHNPDKTASHKIEIDSGKGFALAGEDTCKK